MSTTNLSDGRVATFTVTAPGQAARTTSLDYSVAGQTTVTDPEGHRYTYAYDTDLRTASGYNPDDNPATSYPQDDPEPDSPDVNLTAFDTEPDATAQTCTPDPDLGADDSYCYYSPVSGGSTRHGQVRAAGLSSDLAPGGPGWGLADQTDDFMFRPGFRALGPDGTGLHRVRVIIPWDAARRARTAPAAYTYRCTKGTSDQSDDTLVPVSARPQTMTDDGALGAADAFVTEALKRQYEVTITIGKSGDGGAACYLPSLKEYETWVGALMDRYPQVTHFTTWNEPNDAGQPTSREKDKADGPKRAAQFYKEMVRLCKAKHGSVNCQVASPDFLDNASLLDRFTNGGNAAVCDSPSAPSDCRSYLRRYTDALLGAKAPIWAFHAYEAAHITSPPTFPTAHTLVPIKRVISEADRVSGVASSSMQFWATEQGGRAHALTQSGAFQGPAAANSDLTWLLANVPTVDSRIDRFFLYQYKGGKNAQGKLFDSGLVDYRAAILAGNGSTTDWAKRRMYCTYLARTIGPTAPCTYDPVTDSADFSGPLTPTSP